MSVLHGARPRLGSWALSLDGDAIMIASREHREIPGSGLAADLARLVEAELPADADERAIPVDQTQISVIVDDRLVVKIVRSWGAADRSARLLGLLATAGVEDVPGYLGGVAWEHPERGRGMLATITRYVPDAPDGWSWAPDALLTDDDPGWARDLGAAIARIHAGLATAGPLGDDLPTAEAAANHARAVELLEIEVDASPDATGRRLRHRIEGVSRALLPLASRTGGAPQLRHGDLHLGQVLRRPDGRLTVIDFDGDPQLSAAENDAPGPPERDLAHLVTSIDLAASVAQRRLGRAEPGLFDRAAGARQALLDGYRAQGGEADEVLIAAMSAARLLAELGYARRFLPRWRYAPDGVISHRFAVDPGIQEEPWSPPPSATT